MTETEATGLRHGDISYVSLWVPDLERAAEFFFTVLDWRYASASGRQGRQVDGLDVPHGLWGGVPVSTLICCFAVDDVGVAVSQVRAAGGSAEEPLEEPHGLISACVDDQGVRFSVVQRPQGGSAVGRQIVRPGGQRAVNGSVGGDLAYVTMEVIDSAKARAFYASVLDWQFQAGQVADGWQVDGVAPMAGLSGGHAVATTVPMYRVDDILRAVSAVRRAGGTATVPEAQPYGSTSTCTDDQGTRFYLGQL